MDGFIGDQCEVAICPDGTYRSGDSAQLGPCLPCDACGSDEFQVAACEKGGLLPGSNTVCARCTLCEGDGEYYTQSCGGTHDSQCATCHTCLEDDQYYSTACVRGNLTSPGSNSECTTCSVCGDGEYVEATCESLLRSGPDEVYTAKEDTRCTACATSCEDGEYVSSLCEAGNHLLAAGRDLECLSCGSC